MKQLIILLLLGICLTGCSKEKRTNRLLHGKWTVDLSTTRWTNANINYGKPQYNYVDNFATIEFDKKGKGRMVIPADVYFEEENFELIAGVERIYFNYNPPFESESFGLTWEWDKKTFVLSNGDIYYDNNTSTYYERKFICKKKD